MKRSPTPSALTVAPLHADTNMAEPCVSVQKMREFGEKERFDRWCIKHHHWLNEVPAKTVGETL